jgi:phosphorylcholine metabolism protein LicD
MNIVSQNKKVKYKQKINEKELIKDLFKIKKIFEEYDIFFWLDYGTLLGAVRDNKFITWDDDVDLGIWNGDYFKIKKARFILKKEGFLVCFYRNHKVIIRRLNYKIGDHFFEIHVYTPDISGKFIESPKYLKNDVRISSSIDFYVAFSPINFYGDFFNIPSDFEKYLKFFYGNSWKKPIYEEHSKIPNWINEKKIVSFFKKTKHNFFKILNSTKLGRNSTKFLKKIINLIN